MGAPELVAFCVLSRVASQLKITKKTTKLYKKNTKIESREFFSHVNYKPSYIVHLTNRVSI